MRVKRPTRGFNLMLALVLLTAFLIVPVYSDIQLPRWVVKVVVDNVVYHHHPFANGQQRETAMVVQGQTFIIRHLSEWSEPEAPGYYLVAIYWDCFGNPSENLTFLYAQAYFTSDPHVGEPIDATVSTADNGTRYTIGVSNTAGDSRDGQFNVDVVMRASGAGGVPHIPGYHTIFYTVLYNGESGFEGVDPMVIEVLPAVGVEVSILPENQSGPPGGTLTYTVTIMNKGGVVDNYGLVINESADPRWNPTLLDNLVDNRFENVQPGENRQTTLGVIVSDNAVPCTEDNITVTATSQENGQISDNASCIAHVAPWAGTAVLKLENLYAVSVNKNLQLYAGSKLVVKFYRYGGAFEDENIIETITPPSHIEEIEDVPHPQGRPVENVRLDLTTDNSENVISTIASFIVTRDVLHEEIKKEYIWWPLVPPPDRARIFREISDKYMQWPFAPWW